MCRDSLLLLAIAAFLSPEAHCACVNATARPAIFFWCELTGQDLNLPTDGGTISAYSVHQLGYAGIPRWLRATAAGSSMVLYGTPAEEDEGSIQLTVIAVDSTFRSSNASVELLVQRLQGHIAQYSEFYITSHNLEDLLFRESYEELRASLMEVFGMQPVILALVDPRDRNRAAPQPPAKLGAILQVAPGLDADMALPTATPQAASSVQSNCSGGVAAPPFNFEAFSQRGFTIDWCQYVVQSLNMVPTTAGTGKETSLASAVVKPAADGSILVLVVIAVAVGVVSLCFICVLTCVFFCRRRFSPTLSKSRRSKNSALLKDTNSSILEVSTAQVLLRSLSSAPPPEGGVALVQERPESAGLEYRDVKRNTEMEPSPPPAYHYNQQLVPNRSSTPSS